MSPLSQRTIMSRDTQQAACYKQRPALPHFADRLAQAIERKNSRAIVGIDPRLDLIPQGIRETNIARLGETMEAGAAALLEFSRRVIDAVEPHAVGVKPQVAFYEQWGWHGFKAFVETVEHAKRKGLLVVGDVKRGDIGSTAEAYAAGLLGRSTVGSTDAVPLQLDAVTVNPYLGIDGVEPFIQVAEREGKGIFVLVKTSNPSSSDFQDLVTRDGLTHEIVADRVAEWGRPHVGECGYSSVGAVVGATHPEALAGLRKRMPHTPFLVPGYGAQGGGAADVAPAFDARGLGAVVNSSRGIIFAYAKDDPSGEGDWTAAVEAAAVRMKNELNAAIGVGP